MTSTTRPTLDPLDATLLDLARSAVQEELSPGEQLGELLGADFEDDVAVSVRFAAATPGYAGWVWTVTLAVVDPERATVSEVALLPGPDALLPPAWVPWAERIRPGDLSPGDLLPPPEDDPRLVPAYVQSDDPAVEALAVELGLGRSKVMSREGRLDLAQRLHDGDFGPTSPMAQAAPGSCLTCGFYLPLAGSLGVVAGVCGNEWANADSRLVDAGYGCGAHSDVVVPPSTLAATPPVVVDDLNLELHPRAEESAPADGADVADPEAATATDVADAAGVADAAAPVDTDPVVDAVADAATDVADASADAAETVAETETAATEVADEAAAVREAEATETDVADVAAAVTDTVARTGDEAADAQSGAVAAADAAADTADVAAVDTAEPVEDTARTAAEQSEPATAEPDAAGTDATDPA